MPKFQKIVIMTALVILTNLASLKVALANSDTLEFDINQKINSLFKNSIESVFAIKTIHPFNKENNNTNRSTDYQTNLVLIKDPIKPIDLPKKEKLSFVKVNSNYQKEINLKRTKSAIRPRNIASAHVDPNLETKRNLVQNIANQYQVDWKVLEAIWQVESGKSWNRLVTSADGALGPMQFLPSTFRRYAQDGDGDGSAKIENSADALASAANLLK